MTGSRISDTGKYHRCVCADTTHNGSAHTHTPRTRFRHGTGSKYRVSGGMRTTVVSAHTCIRRYPVSAILSCHETGRLMETCTCTCDEMTHGPATLRRSKRAALPPLGHASDEGTHAQTADN
eukprot:scaffold13227_cov117-Isochrysis_galbana.AAC.8